MGEAVNDSAQSVQQTSDGGFIMAGATTSFGPSGNNAWIMKLDEDGIPAWQKAYGGTEDEYMSSIMQTADGGYIASGYTTSFGAGGQDVWIMKLDSNGGIEWQKAYGGTLHDHPYAVQQTADGGYIAISYTTTFGQGRHDVWLLKLDENGDIVWQNTYGGSEYEYGWFVQQTSDGGYIVAGDTSSSGAGASDAWIMKLNSNGGIEWQKAYGGPGNEYAYAVQQTSDLGYIVTAETSSFGAGSRDIWVFKLDPSGNVVWQKTYGGTGNEYPWSVRQTQDLGYIVAGGTNSFGAGLFDGWLLKLDANGNVIWQKTYGGSEHDFTSSAKQTGDGGYIVAGDSASFGEGNRHAWVLKLDISGSIGSCPFEGISTASITDTAATVTDTNAISVTSAATVTDATATVTDSIATPLSVCGVPSGPERMKIGTTRKKQGNGTVTSLDGLIDCPADACQTLYTTGVSTILTATPSPLSTFLGWKPIPSGCESTNPVCQVTMDDKKTVKAIFQGPSKLNVRTTFKRGATGTVTGGDTFVNCPGDCEEIYTLNAPVTLTANEGTGSKFTGWTGKPCKDETTNSCTFTMDKNVTVKATFEPTP